MFPPDPGAPPPDWRELVAAARERIAAKKERLEAEGLAAPPTGAPFSERYDHLLAELLALLGEVPELEIESHGSSGARIAFPPTEREVRITALEETGFVHFVFGHAGLGSLHRAEHHASRPFGEERPDVPKLARQLLAFLVDGTEPRWMREPPPGGPAPGPRPVPAEGTLELPLD